MRNALILGTTGSLGSAIAESLIKQNYTIVGTKRSSTSNKNLPITLLDIDFSSKESIDKVINQLKPLGPFDVFTSTIANKPIFERFENIDDLTFEKDIQLNIVNFVYFLKKIIPLINRDGSIIFILSTYVFDKPPKYCSSYVASKYYLLGLMKVLSQELKPKNIRVNALSPGMMETNFINSIPDIVKKIYVESRNDKSFVNPKDVSKEFIRILFDESLNGENIIVE